VGAYPDINSNKDVTFTRADVITVFEIALKILTITHDTDIVSYSNTSSSADADSDMNVGVASTSELNSSCSDGKKPPDNLVKKLKKRISELKSHL
jgi:hypothetical protein